VRESNRTDALGTPAGLREKAEELARLLGGHVPEDEERRAGSSRWAPFGFVPFLVDGHGARGLFAPRGDAVDPPESLPVAWWDAARGQLSPLAGRLDRYVEVVRAGIRYDRPITAGQAETALALDPEGAAAAVALAGCRLDEGRPEEARRLLERAADAASWWMAPCLLLAGVLRLQGRLPEAARWGALALGRRWDATGAGRRGLVPRLGPEPRRLLRSAVVFVRRQEAFVPGLCFDPAWRAIRDAEEPLSVLAHVRAARALAATGRRREAAARWEWLALASGVRRAAERAEEAYAELGWPLHHRHSRLLRLSAGG
jgi:hypothetical protein